MTRFQTDSIRCACHVVERKSWRSEAAERNRMQEIELLILLRRRRSRKKQKICTKVASKVGKTSTFQASYFNRIAKLWNYICKFSTPTSFPTTASFRNFVTEHMFHLLHNHFDIYYPCTWSIVRSCPCHL